MKTQLIAALLLSTAVVAAPAFANGNPNLGNDTSNWAGASTLTRAQVRADLIASQKAGGHSAQNVNVNLEYPTIAANSTTSRTAVREELSSASGRALTGYDNLTYPATSIN